MKILRTDNFISERVKVKPITNAEWNTVKNELQELQGSINIVKPGDMLKASDMVLVIVQNMFDEYEYDIKYGIYFGPTTKNPKGVIEYAGATFISYENLISTFEYIHNKNYSHHIAKIFRPQKVNENILSLFVINDFEELNKKLEHDKNYMCVYKNPKLLKKYNIS